jgi:hypothetical protein
MRSLFAARLHWVDRTANANGTAVTVDDIGTIINDKGKSWLNFCKDFKSALQRCMGQHRTKTLYMPSMTGIVSSSAFRAADDISKSDESDDEYTQTTIPFAGLNLADHHDRQQRLLYYL